MQNRADWEEVGSLGHGGQSDVFLVRTPERSKERARSLEVLGNHPPSPTAVVGVRDKANLDFAEALCQYARADLPSELGAMKVFRIREDGGEEQALNRLKREMEVLQQRRPGLPKLLGFNEAERWMVTEYFPQLTLEDKILRYKGKPALALKAFQSLVRTVAALHAEDIVHRDIKPANVFIGNDGELVLGDFGIVFLPNLPNRLTRTDESVGPHDYMPPWTDVGARLENVHPNFDVYMLGKVLWCMVSGRLLLQREWFTDSDNDVTVMFRDDPHAFMINDILSKCVVDRPQKCLASAMDLLLMVNALVRVIENRGQLLRVGVPRPCHVCGLGHYQPEPGERIHNARLDRMVDQVARDTIVTRLHLLTCDYCGHVQFFKLP